MSKNPHAIAKKTEGNTAFKAKDYNAAIQRYSEAISLDDTDATFFSNRSACYAAKSMWREAYEDGRRCITVVEGNVRAAVACREMGDLEGAWECITLGLEIEAPNGDYCSDMKEMQKDVVDARRTQEEEEKYIEMTQETSQTQSPVSSSSVSLYANASLYVGDLADDCNEPILYDAFNKPSIGTLVSVKICRDTVTKKSLGYGYVNYQTHEEADCALDILNHTNITTPSGSRPCRIMWSERDANLRNNPAGNVFVKGLNKDMNEDDLEREKNQRLKAVSYARSTNPRVLNGNNNNARGGAFQLQQQMYTGGGSRYPNRGGYAIPNYPSPNYFNRNRPPLTPGMTRTSPQYNNRLPTYQQQRGGFNQGGFNNPKMPQVMHQAPRPVGFNIYQLHNLPQLEQVNYIGEELYSKILAKDPHRAGKITGMLLELDVTELLDLIESPDLLQEKVQEAIKVLVEAHLPGGGKSAAIDVDKIKSFSSSSSSSYNSSNSTIQSPTNDTITEEAQKEVAKNDETQGPSLLVSPQRNPPVKKAALVTTYIERRALYDSLVDLIITKADRKLVVENLTEFYQLHPHLKEIMEDMKQVICKFHYKEEKGRLIFDEATKSYSVVVSPKEANFASPNPQPPTAKKGSTSADVLESTCVIKKSKAKNGKEREAAVGLQGDLLHFDDFDNLQATGTMRDAFDIGLDRDHGSDYQERIGQQKGDSDYTRKAASALDSSNEFPDYKMMKLRELLALIDGLGLDRSGMKKRSQLEGLLERKLFGKV